MKKLFFVITFLFFVTAFRHSRAETFNFPSLNGSNLSGYFPSIFLSTIILDDNAPSCRGTGDPSTIAVCSFDYGTYAGGRAVDFIQKASNALRCGKAPYGYQAAMIQDPSSVDGYVAQAKTQNGKYLSCTVNPTQIGFEKLPDPYDGDYENVVKACIENNFNTIVINRYTKEVFLGKVQ